MRFPTFANSSIATLHSSCFFFVLSLLHPTLSSHYSKLSFTHSTTLILLTITIKRKNLLPACYKLSTTSKNYKSTTTLSTISTPSRKYTLVSPNETQSLSMESPSKVSRFSECSKPVTSTSIESFFSQPTKVPYPPPRAIAL